MNEQLALIEEAFRRARSQPLSGVPIDIAVARQYGDSTVTLRTQLPARGGNSSVQPRAAGPSGEAFTLGDLSAVAKGKSDEGVDRKVSTASFFDPPSGGDGVARGETSLSWADGESSMQVGTLLAEIERLKRKALSRGVNLTSPQEDVPAEDVAMLRQVCAVARGERESEREVVGSAWLEEMLRARHNSQLRYSAAAREETSRWSSARPACSSLAPPHPSLPARPAGLHHGGLNQPRLDRARGAQEPPSRARRAADRVGGSLRLQGAANSANKHERRQLIRRALLHGHATPTPPWAPASTPGCWHLRQPRVGDGLDQVGDRQL